MQVVSVTATSGTTSPVETRTTQVAVMPILPDNVILCDRRGSGRSGSAAPRPSIGAPKDNTSIFSKDRET